jgi:hypothetical protein
VDEVAATYQATATAQESMVALLTEQNRIAAASLKALEDAEFARQHEAAEAYYEAAYTAAQAAGDTGAMLAALGQLRDLSLAQAARATDDLLAMQSSFGAVGQQIVAAQILAVHQSAVDMVAATDRTAAAIVAGFSAADVAAAHAADIAARQHVDVLAAQSTLREIMFDVAAALQGLGRIHSEEVVTGDMFLPSRTVESSAVGRAVVSTSVAVMETVVELKTLVAVSVAASKQNSLELEQLAVKLDALTSETRRTGEALAVA